MPLLKEENHLHPEQSIICVAVKLQSASSKIHFFEDKRLDTFQGICKLSDRWQNHANGSCSNVYGTLPALTRTKYVGQPNKNWNVQSCHQTTNDIIWKEFLGGGSSRMRAIKEGKISSEIQQWIRLCIVRQLSLLVEYGKNMSFLLHELLVKTLTLWTNRFLKWRST